MAERPSYYTLAEHENVPGCVVAVAFTGAVLRAKITQHCGVVYEDWSEADEAAEAINDRFASAGGIVPDVENGAHMTGFTRKVIVDGRRMYIPLREKKESVD
jgi:hypothetical protein